MTLDGVIGIAGSGLDSIGRRLAVVSQNVANAGTPGYVRASVPVLSASAGGVGMGVRTGVATRSVDEALQADVFAAGASVGGQQVRADALAAIDAVSGTPGSGTDLPSLLGVLRDSMSRLSGDPSNQTQQGLVVQQAGTLARGVNGLAAAVATARQRAQDGAIQDVSSANAALRDVGLLSRQITQAAARGNGTADLEDQRDRSLQAVSDLTGARFLRQADGSVLAVAGGLVLPTDAYPGPFSLAAATLAPNTPAAAVPRLMVAGQDATGRLTGGRLGAQLALRDEVLPRLQSGLDGFSQALAARFDNQGLPLFSDPAGLVPLTAQPGFALTIQVSAAAQAAPSIIRDGIGPAGQAGASGLIERVLDRVLASGPNSLSAMARSITASHAGLAAEATSRLETENGVQTALTAKLATATGVSVDGELADLVKLQNAYAANAKVLTATQAIWSGLLDAVR